MPSTRTLIAPLAFALALGLAWPTSSPAQAAAAAAEAPVPAPYSLPSLPYAANALEGAIDAETMVLHHERHHGAAVSALNALAASVPELRDGAIEPLFARISTLPVAVRNNLGSHYNHSVFWQVMAPAGSGGAPSAELGAAIDERWGSMTEFRKAFSQAAASRFGSGWAWLVVDADGALAITSTPNQDNPLMDVVDVRGTPVLALDVWEHAYYLKYRNLRGDYIAAWWDVVNWNEVNRRYAELQ